MHPEFLFQLRLDEAEHFIAACVKRAIEAPPQPPPSSPKAQSDQLLRIVEVCKLLGISKPTCAKWRKSGRLPFYRKNRLVYFKEHEIWDSLEKPKHVAL